MKKTWVWVLVIVVILIGIRIALPFIVENYINKTLDRLEGYDGSVGDVDLAIIAGTFSLEDVIIHDDSLAIPVPFISVSKINASLDWGALFKGKITGQAKLTQPAVNFAVDEDATQDGTEVDWQEVIKDMIPIQINRFEISDGTISYYDFTTDPEMDIYIQNFNLLITNLSNVEQENERLPTTINATGNAIGGGKFNVEGKMNALKEIPDLDMTMSMEQVDMTELNDFVRHYTNTDIEQGTFNLYTEIVIDSAQLQGYVKPVLENIEILDWDEEEGGFLKKTWEAVAEGVKSIFENPEEDQVATETPLKGDLSTMNLDAGLWPTIWGLFKNAFVEALSKETDDTLDFPLQEAEGG